MCKTAFYQRPYHEAEPIAGTSASSTVGAHKNSLVQMPGLPEALQGLSPVSLSAPGRPWAVAALTRTIERVTETRAELK